MTYPGNLSYHPTPPCIDSLFTCSQEAAIEVEIEDNDGGDDDLIVEPNGKRPGEGHIHGILMSQDL
ncbi:hypothetical protein T265_02475 [Opisthorchis viverrini]|uniref:Uncharacterized protein n=1 Tax=Opisthorchis viverrini TaxID=6198 RepID=A0A074ZV01_OPIVI|nr:hypothetical protein T265_02475 [Opisthorchis viverrini]KER31293.1 hypothetical protein T265_02475 [Opisthorchis viverrini]